MDFLISLLFLAWPSSIQPFSRAKSKKNKPKDDEQYWGWSFTLLSIGLSIGSAKFFDSPEAIDFYGDERKRLPGVFQTLLTFMDSDESDLIEFEELQSVVSFMNQVSVLGHHNKVEQMKWMIHFNGIIRSEGGSTDFGDLGVPFLSMYSDFQSGNKTFAKINRDMISMVGK